LPDSRDVLARIMGGSQAAPPQFPSMPTAPMPLPPPPPGGLGAPPVTMRPPGDAMVDSPVIGDWAPNANAPFAGLEQWDWKNPNLPPMATGAIRSPGPDEMTPQDLELAKGVFNSMRARGELPFDRNPPVDINSPALWQQIQRDSR
jgi:hypothetical protein